MNPKTNRKLLRVGTPLSLKSLRAVLETIDDPDGTAIVTHYNGELIVTRPDAQFTKESTA